MEVRMDLAVIDKALDGACAGSLALLVEQTAIQAKGDVRHWLRIAHQARLAGRMSEALTLLQAASQRFPNEATVLHDLARLAEAGRDWVRAEGFWRMFAVLRPTAWWGVTQVAHALRQQGRVEDAQALLTEATERFPDESGPFIENARAAELQRDWPEAERRWRIVAERFSGSWEGVTGLARALREQGRPDEARKLLVRAAEGFPMAVGPIVELGRLAESIGNWIAAERWWRISAALEPGAWWAHTSLANALREQRRLPEADAVLAAQIERLGHEPAIFIDYARLAERASNWPEAARRWEAVSIRFPQLCDGLCGRARSLREQGQIVEARAILTEAIKRFPNLAAPLHDLARLAEAEKDWVQAADCWRRFLELDSNSWWAWAGLANTLREHGELAAGKRVLFEAAERFPNEPEFGRALARFAELEGDSPAAIRLWERLKERFPDDWTAHLGLIAALIKLRGTAEAEPLLVETQRRFPDRAWFAIEYARLADSKRDWIAAEARWQQAADRFPSEFSVRIGHINATREVGNLDTAAGLLASAADLFPADLSIFNQQALLHEAQENWSLASQAWLRCIAADPGNEGYYIRGAVALLRSQRDAEAEELLERALSVAGNRPALLRERGILAERRGDWPEAIRRYRHYVACYPDYHDAIGRLAYTLGEDGKLAEGEAVLADAIEAYPDLPELSIAYARMSLKAGPSGHPVFVERCRAAVARFPDFAEAHSMLANALVRVRKLTEAEAVLRHARARFPLNVGIARAFAVTLTQQSRWDDAIEVFSKLCADFPADSEAVLEYANALVAACRWDDAVAVVDQALQRFPTSGGLHIVRLDVAIGIGRYEQAAELYRSAEARFSTSLEVRRALFERRSKMLDLGIDLPLTEVALGKTASLGEDDNIKIADIVGLFESLGGSGIGCEFGQFQRRHAAEPLGLLRWTEMQPQQLAEALETGFEGVGRPEQTILDAEHGDHNEYTVSDKRFGMRMHTFVPARSVPSDKMFVQICRRLSFLRAKLLDDLAAGGKIFVYKNAFRTLDEQEIERLHAAIRRYGDTTLLYVRRESEDTRCPTVVSPKPGLLVGHIDRFELLANGQYGSLPTLSWGAIVMNAYRAWKGLPYRQDSA
jgi:tetratricopeptide (TPR) repeat protein